MEFQKWIFVTWLFILFISCNKSQEIENMDGLINEQERMIMDECSKSPLTSKIMIENNIIGEWKLIGHGNPLFQSEVQAIINLTFLENELIYEFNNNTDTLSWEIEDLGSSEITKFRLLTNPSYVTLGMHQFCDDFMFSNYSNINDGGRMYLYEKVQ